jgi:hypothetical protein
VTPPVRLPLALDGFAEGPIGSFLVEGSANAFKLIVSARADGCRDASGKMYPDLVVSLDGRPVGTIALTSSDFVQYSTGPFALSGGLQKIVLSMAADFYEGPRCDRNVHLDWLEMVAAEAR